MGTVLVIDDVELTRRAVAAVVGRCGHTALNASSGEQALGLLATRPVDLILLDVMLPGLGGHEVLRALRADPRTAALPVVVFSAVGDPALRDYLMREGASDYWVKGQVDYGTLERRLATYLPPC